MSGGVVALIVILCVVSVAGLVAGLAFLERSGCEDARAAGALSLRTNSAHAMRCAAPKRRGQRAHASTHLSVFSGRPSVVKIKKKMIKVVLPNPINPELFFSLIFLRRWLEILRK